MSQALLSATKFVRSSTVVSREIAGETLVVPVRGGVGDLDAIFSFNGLGSDLWNLLQTAISIEEMADWVEERYEVTFEQALADINAFMDELSQAGLVHQDRQQQGQHGRPG
jgi:Coenzyme PQQ synthesis protein D (PqqD)